MKVDKTTAAAVEATTSQKSEEMKHNTYNNDFKISHYYRSFFKVVSCNSFHKLALLFTWLVFKYLHVCWRQMHLCLTNS